MNYDQQSAKNYAQWLHTHAGLPYEEACKWAGFDPMKAYRKELFDLLTTITATSLVGLACFIAASTFWPA